jgi:aryl-alcohol dehydrogenase-like predicted oxidoreductase
VGLQIEYSLIERTSERELLPMAVRLGLGVTAWSPLAGGLLTGKQLEVAGTKDSRQSNPMMKEFMTSDARKEAIAREVVNVAREWGHSPAQVALAWLRQRTTPVIPIIGARKLARERLKQLVCDKRPAEERLRDLYLIALSRPPSAEEMADMQAYLQARPNTQAAAYEDLLWVLLNTKEFLYNH